MEAKLPYERVLVSSLKFDGRNARKHDKKNLKAIKDSLTKFGLQKPIVVTKDNVVIAGNGTLAAAKELGWDTIDISRSQLTKDEALAYAIVDNRTTDLSVFDNDILADVLTELDGLEWDLEGLGFDSDDIDSIMGIDDESTSGNTEAKLATCPKCGHDFKP